jgi:hypothetical protein
MPSFAMVYAEAPLFMWIYGVRSAIFVNNITARYYRIRDLWSWFTPHHLTQGEAFADSSIVVPFGCAALILRDSDDRPKFENRFILMIFVHYGDDHPLFTYAFFSPRTKRVLYRQDCIFLPTVFPMRQARTASGMSPDGEILVGFRCPTSLREGCLSELSFGDWMETDGLPEHDDDVLGFNLSPPLELCWSILSISRNWLFMSRIIQIFRFRQFWSHSGRVLLGPVTPGTLRLGLTLTFPDDARCDQRYSVSMYKSVPDFKLEMARLLRADSPVTLTVSPDWLELDHLGTVIDRFFPGTSDR